MTLTNTETSSRLFEIVEEGYVFEEQQRVNDIVGRFMEFERLADDMDGVFPRVSDWKRLCNKIDEEGASAFLTWVMKGKEKKNVGYCTIIRESKFSDKAAILFKEPVRMVLAEINELKVVAEIDRIEGEFAYEWGWFIDGRQSDIANEVTIFFNCVNLFNSSGKTNIYVI